MSSALLPVLVGLVAAVAGVPVARWLRRVGYRKPDEEELPHPGSRWWVPPTLAVVAAVITWRVVVAGGEPQGVREWATALVLALTLGAVGLACVSMAAMDMDVHRLPDRLMWPALAVLLAGTAVAAVLAADGAAYLRVVLAMLVCGGAYLLVALLTLARGSLAIGLGDVKLAGLLGGALGWFGWSEVGVGMYAGVLVGGLVALALLLLRRVSVRQEFAYGPAMMVGGLVGLLAVPGAVSGLLGWA